MKRLTLLLMSAVFLGLAALYALEAEHDSLSPYSKGLRMVDSLKLSDEELLKAKKDALAGSPSAGAHLVDYYLFYKSDDEQVLYWAQIAAENGDAKNAYNYANFLSMGRADVMSLIRARFWARRAIEEGNPNGKRLLSEIDNKIDSSPSNEAK